MARTQTKAKQGSLAAMAAGLDTRKKPLPADTKPTSVEALREVVKARVDAPSKAERSPEKTVPAPAKAVPAPAKAISAPAKAISAPAKAISAPAKTVPAPAKTIPAPKPAVAAKVTMMPKPRSSSPKAAAKSASSEVARPVALPSVSRSAALSSLHRTPAAPVKVAAPKVVKAADNNTRRYPRATIEVRARLSLADDPSRSFEATLPTVNISVGGLFLESSFFLKLGTKLSVELQLPPKGRTVHVKADVVRVETNGGGASGFALRFTEYFDGSEVVLATHFLSPVLKEFITAYAKQHRFDASAEYIAHTADVLAAWELKKAELGGDVWSLTPST